MTLIRTNNSKTVFYQKWEKCKKMLQLKTSEPTYSLTLYSLGVTDPMWQSRGWRSCLPCFESHPMKPISYCQHFLSKSVCKTIWHMSISQYGYSSNILWCYSKYLLSQLKIYSFNLPSYDLRPIFFVHWSNALRRQNLKKIRTSYENWFCVTFSI